MRFLKSLKDWTHVLTFVAFGYFSGTVLSIPGGDLPLIFPDQLYAQDGSDSLMVSDSAAVDTGEVVVAPPPKPETPLEKALKRVNEDTQGMPSLRMDLAMEYMKLQKYDDAINTLKEAVGLDSNYVEANFWMARAYRDKGDKKNMYRQLIVVMESIRGDEFVDDVKPFVGSSFEIVQVTNNTYNDIYPSFSPDGSKILFQSDRSGSWDIFEMSVGSTGEYATKLTDSPAQEESPAYSADGKLIVYTSTADAIGDHDLAPREVYLMDQYGGNKRRITDSYSNDNWSPTFYNSHTIIFTSDRLDFSDAPAWKKKSDIFTTETSGKFLLDKKVDENFSYKDPAVDESGTYMVYASDKLGSFDLYISDLEGKDEKLLVKTPGDEIQPRFSKTGDFLTFSSSQKGDFDIYRSLPTGQDVERVTSGLADEIFPSFSPDGAKIIYASNQDGKFQLYMADLDAKTELTKDDIIEKLKAKL